MKKWGFLVFPILALAVGGLAGYLSRTGLETVYPQLEKSPLTPPGAVFPIVWVVLYILMGVGLALVVYRGGPGVKQAALLWGLQLALNFSWSLLFFAGGHYLAALFCLVVFVAGHPGHDRGLCGRQPPGGLAADPLSSVGGLCGLPQRRRLAAQPVITQKSRGGLPCQRSPRDFL